jgi:raffinose/stachyose/melibiose transport system substrate-binding protein
MKIKKSLAIFFIMLCAFSTNIFAQGSSEATGDKEITLKWASIWVGADTKAEICQTLVDEFNTANAGKIKVVIEENPDYDAFKNKLNSQMAAGSAPDIFVFNPDQTTFKFYQSDIMMDFTNDLKGTWGDNFASGTVAQATVNGKTKSVPFEMGYTPIWYNMDILDAAGIDTLPTTYDEFFAACDKIKAAGYIPTSQMTGGTNAWTSMLWFSHIAAALGGQDVWEKPLTDPVFVQAAEILLEMYSDGNTSSDAVGGDAGVSGGHYLSGDSAMFINGPWYIGRVKSEAPEVYAATKVGPAPGANYSGAQVGFPQSNLAAANTDDPVRRAAVVKFMQFMTSSENAKRIADASGSMLAIKYESSADADPLQAQFQDAVNNADFVVSHFQFNYPVQVMAEFGQALAKMTAGRSTPEEFCQELAAKNK